MRKLTRLWQALERIPGLCEVPAYWEQHCGPDYPLIRPHLRPIDEIGAHYPCPHPRDSDCPRKIIDYADGTFAAICRHPHQLCDRLPLAQKDALIHRLDIEGFVRQTVSALCVRPKGFTARTSGVWELGTSTSRATRNYPAFLLVFTACRDFDSAIRDLLLGTSVPFVVVAPTMSHLMGNVREHLARRQCDFISLEERIGFTDGGQFVALEIADAEELAPTPVGQRQAVVEKYNRDFTYTDAQIYRDARVHKSDFYKWIKGALNDKSTKSKQIEEVLRTAPSSRTRR
jgi:hypothetical protein